LDHDLLRLKRRNRLLGWLAGILVVAVVALGAWMIFGDSGGQNLTAEQEQMLEMVDEALVHWNAGDGDALAALFASTGYHDNGSNRYDVAGGELAAYVKAIHELDFSVRSGEHYVIGNYVVSEGFIPETSEVVRLGIHAMSADGTKILWHLAP
jgi:hypothetical protein